MEPSQRIEFETERLVAEFPPAWDDPNKAAVYEISSPPGSRHSGKIEYSRWNAGLIPKTFDVARAADIVEPREDVYDYVPTPGINGECEWHVNFADPVLFVAYSTSLFAQDEMQVTEHPALGSLREALTARGEDAYTAKRGVPTPILVAGVERRCRVATDPDPEKGRPFGLYGNEFGSASVEAVKMATEVIAPPTVTNLIAIAAPSGGGGRYSVQEIALALTTAFTGFRAAKLESERLVGKPSPVVVHTGFWGCGAFGGNRILMAMLQALAASMAGVEKLVFHTHIPSGTEALRDALRFVREELVPASDGDAGRAIRRIEMEGFRWGVSDGN